MNDKKLLETGDLTGIGVDVNYLKQLLLLRYKRLVTENEVLNTKERQKRPPNLDEVYYKNLEWLKKQDQEQWPSVRCLL